MVTSVAYNRQSAAEQQNGAILERQSIFSIVHFSIEVGVRGRCLERIHGYIVPMLTEQQFCSSMFCTLCMHFEW